MIKTPLGNITVVENKDREYPGVEVLITFPDGTEDRIALIEYQKDKNQIATYTYEEDNEDFMNKTIYMKGDN